METSLQHSTTAVLDVGKTLSKLSFWSADGRLLDRHERPNAVIEQAGARRLDVAGIGDWLLERLSSSAAPAPSTLVPVAHGAGVALLVGGQLAAAPLDYEQPPPPEVLEAYRAERDAFALTGSPLLPDGLNLGAQLYWLERQDRQAMQTAVLVPWAQYWSWFLSGVAGSEVTSLGCHTDLWNPGQRVFSPLARRRGWDTRFAPLRRADEVVGTLRPALADRTRLDRSVRVLCGLHDSNAALLAAKGLPELAGRDATVLSTGTWFIAMRSPREPSGPGALGGSPLPEGRDCLLNVDVEGRMVPSARFMGGRELEMLLGGDTPLLDRETEQSAMLAAVPRILGRAICILPTLKPGTGPCPNSAGGWQNEPQDRIERAAAAAIYAALVADVSLDLIGARDILLVEGRFARCEVFVRALASLRCCTRVFTAELHDDVPLGALRLVHPDLAPANRLRPVHPLPVDLLQMRDRWRKQMEAA